MNVYVWVCMCVDGRDNMMINLTHNICTYTVNKVNLNLKKTKQLSNSKKTVYVCYVWVNAITSYKWITKRSRVKEGAIIICEVLIYLLPCMRYIPPSAG